ncbi:hypothetical protein QTN24_15785 [Cupriavidus sp. SZY C1]|uniref:hypothetical protein n=1 Tax=Cupriavidus sp. SZY C1 TaxID=3055037 RepID=UPI0028B723DB|nr:hypothetical protein [Cupriavidus sp. SZY C1]MDT6962959.1 hypothetical protein [Cupriavidus sp. SZY C1]
MSKRRPREPGKTVFGTNRLRRPAAIGEELERLAGEAMKAFASVGAGGLTRAELQRRIDIGLDGSFAAIKKLHKDGQIYVATWRKGQPAYAAGQLNDVPRPEPYWTGGMRGKKAENDGSDFAEIARAEVLNAHAKWAATWVPHRDPAAAWIGGAV